ncbi:MAG TPA: phage holin family protein [Candidatus Dormibacteraeota bacterium]|nr:phage holin family protein [Candidatus Dormibacteraeota bacterium]
MNGAEGVRPKVGSGELAAEVVQDAQRLVNLEIALAKQELKDLATANAIAAGMVGAGGLLVMLALLVAVPSLIVALVPDHWIAAAAWVGAYLVVGLLLVLAGRARFQFKLPPKTIASLKENKEWALRQIKSTVR